MITLILLPFAALYVVLLIMGVRQAETWPWRVVVAVVMLSPVIYMVGSYQYAHYRHEQDCALEGGLRILVQPEKADRIRLDADSLLAGDRPEFFLKRYYPLLMNMEASNGESAGKGKRLYFDYSIDPATTGRPKNEWRLIKNPLAQTTPHTYELSEHATVTNHREKVVIKLSLDGTVMATWTMFSHFWSRNGAMNIGWQCHYKDERGRASIVDLVELILQQISGG